MKKIVLFSIVCFYFIGWIFGNRDAVSYVNYGATAHNPLSVTLKFDNLLTSDNPDYHIDGANLFSYADFEVEDGGCTIVKNSDNIKITYGKTNSGTPGYTHTCTISVTIDEDDIKEYVNNHLNVDDFEEKQKILNSITYGLYDQFKVVLKLTTDSNGNNLSDYTAALPGYTLEYKYKYKKPDCSDGIDNDGDGKVDYSGVDLDGDGFFTGAGEYFPDPDCTSPADFEDGSALTQPVNKPDCSDGIDNDGDGKVDYSNDPGCSSSEDTNEDDEIKIQNVHQIPQIDEENFQSRSPNNIQIDNSDMGGKEGKIIVLADWASNYLSTHPGSVIPIGKVKVIHNGTNNAKIKKINLTVMKLEGGGLTPYSSNCIYQGTYNSPKGQGKYIHLYVRKGCEAIKKAGNYIISFQYVDTAGYTSSEYLFDFKVIPGQIDQDNTILLINKIDDPIYGDAYSKYKYILYFKDKEGNIIRSRNSILKSITLTSSEYPYINEITNQGNAIYLPSVNNANIDSNGKYINYIYSYNRGKVEGTKFKIQFYRVKPKISYPYYELILSQVKSIEKEHSNSLIFDSIVNGFKVMTGEANAIYGFGIDIPIKLVFNIKKYNNSSDLKNVFIKWKPKVYDESGNPVDVDVVAATGYSNILEKLKNGTYFLGNLSKNQKKSVYLKVRLELNGSVTSPKVKLGGEGFIKYNLIGINGEKQIVSKIKWNSNLSVNYRGVYVEGLFSNSSKGLYELFRKSDYKSSQMGKSQGTYLIKNGAYNSIIRNVTKLVRGLDITCSNVNGDIKGICYNNGDITINGGTVKGKSLIFAKGGDVVINGNIKKDKSDSLLTIVAISDDDGNGGHVYIANNVTNIDAIIITEKGVFPIGAKSDLKNYMLNVVKGNKNSELNNQLVIYGLVISRGNTIGGSIKINGKYALPGGKEIEGTPDNFYRAAIYDLNYLRRYHKVFNLGKEACDPRDNSDYGSSCNKLDQTKYGTFPVVIIYDPAIKIYKPYGF